MVLKRLKHHLATLFDNTNTVSKHEQGDLVSARCFRQTFTKSCQISLPNYK